MAYSIFGLLPPGEKPHIPLDDCHEHAAALGRLLGHWAFLESQLIGVMQCLLRTDNDLAKHVWKEFVSVMGKINLLARINYHHLPDEKLRTVLEDLLARADDLNDVRNAYIHALWAIPERGNGDVLERFPNTASRNYKVADKPKGSFTVAQIQADVEKIATVAGELSEWQRQFSTKYQVPAKVW